VHPIPQDIRLALSPYFPAQILEKVRWTTAGGLGIDGALKNWFNQEGAITLDEVIAFSGVDQAKNVELWAHELTHVLQYAQMGVETFAFHYTYNWTGLESQAKNNSTRIIASINSTQTGQPRTWGYSGQPVTSVSQPTWLDITRGARQAINPRQCIWINTQMNTTGNNCPVPIVVSNIILRRSSDGYTFTFPCNEPTCVFGPGQSGPLISPPGHLVTGVTAAYQLQ
jgi:hypothetical protein